MSNGKKLSTDFSKLDQARQRIITKIQNLVERNNAPNFAPASSGLYNSNVPQKIFSINQLPSSQIIKNPKGNADIQIGSESVAGLTFGYGYTGTSIDSMGNNSIALRTGRMNRAKGAEDGDIIDASPFGDAATFYQADMTDCDTNFGFCDGPLGNRKAQSAIVGFADQIRLFGLNGIQISTGQPKGAKFGPKGIRTSRGGAIEKAAPIVLSAGNRDGWTGIFGKRLPGATKVIQGVTKGENMVDCMEELSEIVEDLLHAMIRMAAIQELLTAGQGIQMPPVINAHYGPLTTKAVEETHNKFIKSLVAITKTKAKWHSTYLKDSGSPRFIRSKNVFSS